MSELLLVSHVLLWVCFLIETFCVVLVAIRVRSLLAHRVELPTIWKDSITKRCDLLSDELENLANRVKMMKVRRAADHIRDDDRERGEPDPVREPDLWRAWKNKQLSINGR